MRKDRTRRYQSAAELTHDIQNYLDGAPLLAGPESATYRMGKFIRRYKVYVVTGSIVTLTVFLALAMITKFYLDARKLAETQRRTLYFKNISLVDGIYKNQQLSGTNSLLESCPDDLKGWEWDRLQYILDESQDTIKVSSGIEGGGGITCLNGQYIWACCSDKTIRCWDLDTGQEIRKLPYPNITPKMRICLNHSGSQLAITNDTGIISIYDTSTDEQVLSWQGHKRRIYHLSYCRDDARLLSVGMNQILIWDTSNGQLLMEIPRNNEIWEHAGWSPDGSRIAARQRGKVTIFEAKSGSEIMQFSSTRANHPLGGLIQFSSDNRLICLYHTSIWLYNANTGLAEGALPGHDNEINSLDLSPDSRYAVSGDVEGLIKVWDLSNFSEIATFRGHVRQVLSVGFSADGRKIVSSGNEAIKVWDTENNRSFMDLLGHKSVCSIAFSPDSHRLVSASEDKTLKVWDLPSGSETLTLCGHRGKVSSATFTSDGTKIISGSDDGTVRVWDAQRGDLLAVLDGHEGGILSVTSSSDNRWIASASSDHTIKLWDMDSGKTMQTLLGHQDSVTCVAFNADASRIASGGLDNTIRIWDVGTGRTVAMWSDADLLRANSIVFGRDRTILLAGTSGSYPDHSLKVYHPSRMARIRDSVKGQESLCLIWHAHVGGFSSDGTRFVHRRDLDLEVRDTLTGDLALILKPNCGWSGTAVFSPDGRSIATSGLFGPIGIFESGPPPGGFQIRESARDARTLVDKLYDQLKSYRSVIESIQVDQSLDESIRQFALQISRSRLSAEQYY